MTPNYPIYVPSKDRSHLNLTARAFLEDNVPFRIVVEPQDHEVYAAKYGEAQLLTLPKNNQGLVYVRNWIREHSIAAGAERHWQIDDNIRDFKRYHKGQRIRADANIALRAVEDFTDRYENIALSGMNYFMFVTSTKPFPPFFFNCHVYSCTLINNAMPYIYRDLGNEDVDMCLQVLSGGWCTVAFNAFLATKTPTMINSGGQTDTTYTGDGRLKMARDLQRVWPGVVTTGKRFNRPHFKVKGTWQKFDTPLKLKPGIDLSSLPPNNYGLKLTQVKDKVNSSVLRDMLNDDI